MLHESHVCHCTDQEINNDRLQILTFRDIESAFADFPRFRCRLLFDRKRVFLRLRFLGERFLDSDIAEFSAIASGTEQFMDTQRHSMFCWTSLHASAYRYRASCSVMSMDFDYVVIDKYTLTASVLSKLYMVVVHVI